jgi:hypothetical protein
VSPLWKSSAIFSSVLSGFFAPIRYIVVKIMCSYSEVVLRTTKHTIFYPGSGPSMEVIALSPAV